MFVAEACNFSRYIRNENSYCTRNTLPFSLVKYKSFDEINVDLLLGSFLIADARCTDSAGAWAGSGNNGNLSRRNIEAADSLIGRNSRRDVCRLDNLSGRGCVADEIDQ